MWIFIWIHILNFPTNREDQFALSSIVSGKSPELLSVAIIKHHQVFSLLLIEPLKMVSSYNLVWLSFIESRGWTSFHVQCCLHFLETAYLNLIFTFSHWVAGLFLIDLFIRALHKRKIGFVIYGVIGNKVTTRP